MIAGRPGGAERDADRAAAERPSETVADNDRDPLADAAGEIAAQIFGRSIGIDRQQQHALDAAAVVGRDIRMVDPGIGHHVAEPVLGDHQVRAMPHDAPRLRQDDFDKTGVLLDLGGERPGLRRRLDRGDIDEAALGLRDDLLRDDEHVAVLGRDPGLGIGGERNRGEIVARLDQRHAAEAGDGQLGGHGSV